MEEGDVVERDSRADANSFSTIFCQFPVGDIDAEPFARNDLLDDLHEVVGTRSYRSGKLMPSGRGQEIQVAGGDTIPAGSCSRVRPAWSRGF